MFFSITIFTILQGIISTLIAAIVGIILAIILKGRISLPGPAYLPFLMPSLITGFAWIFATSLFGISAYGVTAIITVHAIINIPLITTVCLNSFNGIPKEFINLSKTLHLSKIQSWYLLELQSIKKTLPITLIFILVISLHSLCIPLLLAGSPKGTTIELAIYQSLCFENNIIKTILISFVAMLISSILFFFIYNKKNIKTIRITTHKKKKIKQTRAWFLSLPLYGFYGLFLLHCLDLGDIYLVFEKEIIFALFKSIILASSSVILSLVYFLTLTAINIYIKKNYYKKFQEIFTLLITTTSPLTISMPFFIFLWPKIPDTLLIIIIHSILVLPLFIINVGPHIQKQIENFSALFLVLNIIPKKKIYILYKGVKTTIKQSIVLGICLCLSELGSINIFNLEIETLSTIIYNSLIKFNYKKSLTVTVLLITLSLLILSFFYKKNNIND